MAVASTTNPRRGMLAIFDGCVLRFDSNTALRASGRKLYRVPQSTRPWTEFMPIGFSSLDGFNDDIDVHQIRFIYHGKQPNPDGADQWLELMRAAFKDYFGFTAVGYDTVGINHLDADEGPEQVEGVWEAAIEFEFMLQRVTLSPVKRGA